VIELKPQDNKVVVGQAEDLMQKEVSLHEMSWSGPEEFDGPVRVLAKIRYNMDAQRATLYGGPTPRLVFDQPVKAVTPGQIAVAYRGKTVFAGGTIQKRS